MKGFAVLQRGKTCKGFKGAVEVIYILKPGVKADFQHKIVCIF